MFTTPRKTPIIGFLAGIKSVQNMYEKLVAADQPKLKYLLTYKMSQDHLELFFCAMRSSLGSNNNPTAREFSTSYRKMLVRHEIEGVNGNCMAQDKTSILHVSSASTTAANVHDDSDMLLMRKYDLTLRSPSKADHDYADVPNVSTLSAYKNSVIAYIAGYVVKMSERYITCEECIAALTTGEVMEGSLLEKKNRGGLVRPSPDVVKVCETTEKCFQRLLSVTGGDLPQASGLTHAISSAVLGEVNCHTIFGSLSDHMFDCEADKNHVYILIKRVASSYIKIRMHHLARRKNEKLSGPVVRKQLSKLILFKHQ